jgi:hypothetical protein
MIILIRGHIRNSFDSPVLYHRIKELHNIGIPLQLYIHTWKQKQNNNSWRDITPDTTIITKKKIKEYFSDISGFIKYIQIDDDSKIKLIGRKTGKVCSSPMPLIGWKNYWYGQYSMMKYIHDHHQPNENILNIRFDLFQYNTQIRNDQFQDFVVTNQFNYFYKNVFFFRNEQDYCIDNIYMGNVFTMFTLCEHFHHNLNNIMKLYPAIKNQEFMVSLENNRIFQLPNQAKKY